eukprot:369857-Alexandrium_andersonii.AAC.1
MPVALASSSSAALDPAGRSERELRCRHQEAAGCAGPSESAVRATAARDPAQGVRTDAACFLR